VGKSGGISHVKKKSKVSTYKAYVMDSFFCKYIHIIHKKLMYTLRLIPGGVGRSVNHFVSKGGTVR
jgi:hypothetical protein